MRRTEPFDLDSSLYILLVCWPLCDVVHFVIIVTAANGIDNSKKKHHMPEKIRNEEDVYMRNSRHTMKRTDIRNVKKRRRKKRELRVARAERQTFDNVVVWPFGRYCKLQIKRKRRGKKYNRNKFVFSAFVFFFFQFSTLRGDSHIGAHCRINEIK